MSRIVSRSEQEPLMRLQRPSSASSQDTAHLVNACLRHFLENTSTPVTRLDRGRVHNLRVSSAEQREGYHKRYVELLKAVHDEHQKRISEVDQIEKHLIKAKAASLAAEEKSLSSLDQQLGLPNGPCQLPQHLDEALLRQHHLLVPSDYLITPKPSVAAPQPPSTPSYFKPTITSDKHSRVTYDEYTASKRATSLQRSSTTSTTRQPTVNKVTTCKPPSLSSNVLVTVGTVDDLVDATVGGAGGFVANPTSVVFTDYLPGKTYQASLQLTNCTGTSKHISVTSPSTGYFSVRVGTFPNSEGSLAPGIACTYLVTFCPDSIATFDDCVEVVSHEGTCLTVPLLGRRPQPLLEMSPLPVWYSHPCSQSVNIITCRNTGTGSGSYSISHKETDESHVTHFTLSSSVFDLAPGGEMHIKVTFYSEDTGEFTYPITISCNNGDVVELTLIGCCELACVGVAGIRPPTGELNTEGWSAPPTTNDITSSEEQVLFDAVNPCQSAYQIVSIRNHCHLELPYYWSLYRPITGPHSQPVPSLHTSYTIEPQSGLLTADSINEFLLTFTPMQPSHFTDDAHLTLGNTEAIELIPSIQLHLAGLCEEYDVILSPGCVVVPGTVQCGTDHSYRVKVVNASLSSVEYHWQEVCEDNVLIKVEPSEGHVVSGGAGHCELILRPLQAGDVTVDLSCNILHRSQPLIMCVRATAVAVPLVLGVPSLIYGLIPNGTSKTLQLPVRNDTEFPIKFHLHETVPPHQLGCLFCVPCDGEVPAHDTIVCSIKCDTSHQPLGEVGTHSSLRTILSCTTELGAESCVQVLAEVQSPKVCLRSCELHVDNAYINIPMDHIISLHNMTVVPAQFTWKEQLFGGGASYCSVRITPSSGLLPPRGSCDLTVSTVWNTEGEDLPAAILCCDVEGMKDPVLLSVTGHVHKLSIHYAVVDSPCEQQCYLDFGSANPLGVLPHPLYLKVTNDTAIPTSLIATVMHFSSGLAQVDKTVESDRSSLLTVTTNLANPKSVSDKTSQSVVASQILSNRKGCSFVVTPSVLEIPARSSHLIEVVAYSDMWGVYSDQLLCQVPGLAPVSIPINYGVIGCPVLFPTTATCGSTIVRFGSHPADSGLVRRTVKLKNTSPCELTVDWEVYNIVRGDQQLVDLTIAVGRPFPIINDDQLSDDGDDVIDDDVMKGSHDLVKVMISAHEGVSSSQPVSIYPDQTVIKGYSNASVELAFTPVVMDTNDGCVSSYVLGHLSLSSDQDYYTGAVRPEGYDIDPIRINVTGKSLYPRLNIEYDSDDGRSNEVLFQFTADKLLSANGEVKLSCYTKRNISLNNSTDMKLTFDLVTLPPFSCDSMIVSPVTLIPSRSAQVSIGYKLTLDEVVKASKNSSLDYPTVTNSEQLVIKYSTGVQQLISLLSRVLLPVISVDVNNLSFGASLLNQSTSQLVTVYNKSNCTSQWKLSIDTDKGSTSSDGISTGVFAVDPSSGITLPRQFTIVTVTFTPTVEVEYAATLHIRGVLGEYASFSVSGTGSADEATLP